MLATSALWIELLLFLQKRYFSKIEGTLYVIIIGLTLCKILEGPILLHI